MAVARRIQVTNDANVPLPSFMFPGMPVGFIVADTTGQNWQLTASTATIDHTGVEACAGNRGLRWLTYSAGGGSGITQLTSDVTAGPGTGSQAATLANLPSTVLATRLAALMGATAGLPAVSAAGAVTKATGVQDFDTFSLIQSTVAPFMAARDATLTKIRFWSAGNRLGGELEAGAIVGSGSTALVPGVGANDWVTRVETGATANSSSACRARSIAIAGGNGAFVQHVANCRTSHYGIWVRVRVNAVTATMSAAIANMTDEATQETKVSLEGATSTLNFCLKVGSAAVQNTGVAIGSLGSAIHDIYMVCDGTTVSAYFDGSTSAAASGASNTGANAAGHWQVNPANGATAANCGFDIIGLAVFSA